MRALFIAVRLFLLVKNRRFLEYVPLNAAAWCLCVLQAQSKQGEVATCDAENKTHPKYCVMSFCSWRLNDVSTVFLGGRESVKTFCPRAWYPVISAQLKLSPLFAEIKLVFSV